MGWTRGLLEGDDSVTKLLPPRKITFPLNKVSMVYLTKTF